VVSGKGIKVYENETDTNLWTDIKLVIRDEDMNILFEYN
jgi:hypothetical protein